MEDAECLTFDTVANVAAFPTRYGELVVSVSDPRARSGVSAALHVRDLMNDLRRQGAEAPQWECEVRRRAACLVALRSPLRRLLPEAQRYTGGFTGF